MNKDIFLRGLLVEMNEASWSVTSFLSFIVIIVFVFGSLIEANSMSAFICERCLFSRIRVQPSYIQIVDPKELLSVVEPSEHMLLSAFAYKPDPLILVILQENLWLLKALFVGLSPVLPIT